MNRIRCLALSAAAAAGVLSLTACKKDAVVAKDESAESVAKKVAASNIKPLPGRWESSMKLDKMDLPGLPPQAREAMTKQMGVTQTFASCLTPEQVNQPGAGFFQKGASDCKYDHFVMADGRLDAAMSCKGAGARAGGIRMTMAGTYSESAYQVAVNSQGEMQPGMPMTMAMTINSRRTGACNGSEEK